MHFKVLGPAWLRWSLAGKLMTQLEKQSWEAVRREGRDRYLLKRIARCGWILVFGALFEVCWWLVTGKASEPVRVMIAKWILLALVLGACTAIDEWKTNEMIYHEAECDGRER